MEQPIRQEETKNEAPFFPEVILPESGEEIYIGNSDPHPKKGRSDDVMMTQCIFCIILVLSMFALHWISSDFQKELLILYKEKVIAPAEPFLANVIETAEQWFRK